MLDSHSHSSTPASCSDQMLSARSAVSTAQNSVDLAKRDVSRNETLEKAGAIAERETERSRNALLNAQTQLSNARAQLANVQKQLDKASVQAPFTGIVAQRQVNAGDVVSPGTALYTVVDPASMQLEASVPAEQLSQARVGMPVEFKVNGYPNRTFTGRITRVNPTADPTTRQVKIMAAIPNAGNTLVGGLFAEGRVSTRDEECADGIGGGGGRARTASVGDATEERQDREGRSRPWHSRCRGGDGGNHVGPHTRRHGAPRRCTWHLRGHAREGLGAERREAEVEEAGPSPVGSGRQGRGPPHWLGTTIRVPCSSQILRSRSR